MSKALEMARELVKQLEEIEKGNKVLLAELEPGDVFKIGVHDFIVLKHDNETTKVISKDLMEKNVVFDNDTKDYSKSNLKKFIEKNIQPLIEEEVGVDNIIEHDVDLISVDMQHEFKNCTCKVRPITFDEARKYNDLLANEDLNDWWWTCTPWSTKERGWSLSIAVVAPSGNFNDYLCYGYCGVRPFCILKSEIFVSKGE